MHAQRNKEEGCGAFKEQKLPEPIPKAENSNTEVNDCVGGTGKCRCVSASPVRSVFPYTTIMDHHHNQTFHLSHSNPQSSPLQKNIAL
jgi:hypothetical protein